MSYKRSSGASCQLHDIQKEVRAAKKAAGETSSKNETSCVWQYAEDKLDTTTQTLWRQHLTGPSPLSAEGPQHPLPRNQRYHPPQSAAPDIHTRQLPKSSKPASSQHPQAADSSTVSGGERCPTLGDSATSFDFRPTPHSEQASPHSTSLPPPPITRIAIGPHIGQRSTSSHQPANASGSALSAVPLKAQGSGGLSHSHVSPEGGNREPGPANLTWRDLQLDLGKPRPLGRRSRRSHELSMGLGPEDIPLLSAARSPSPVGGQGRHGKRDLQHPHVSAETASAGRDSPHLLLSGMHTQALLPGGSHGVHVSGAGRTPEQIPGQISPPENTCGGGGANLRNRQERNVPPCPAGEACSATRAPDARLAPPFADACDRPNDMAAELPGVTCRNGRVGNVLSTRGEAGDLDGSPRVASSDADGVPQECVGGDMAMAISRSITRASSASPMQDLLQKLRRLSDMRAALRAQVADVHEVLTKHPRPEETSTAQQPNEGQNKDRPSQLQSHCAQSRSQQAAQPEQGTCPPISRNCAPGWNPSPGGTALPNSHHGPWMQPSLTSGSHARAGEPPDAVHTRSKGSSNMQRPRNITAHLADITNSSQEVPSHTHMAHSHARAGQDGGRGIGARDMECMREGEVGDLHKMCNAGTLLCSGKVETVAEATDQQCNALGSNPGPPAPSGADNNPLQTIQTPGCAGTSTACDSMLADCDNKQCGMISVLLPGPVLNEHHDREGSGQSDLLVVPTALNDSQIEHHRGMFAEQGSHVIPKTGTGSHEQHRGLCPSMAGASEPDRPSLALAGNSDQPGGSSLAPGDGLSSRGWPVQAPGPGYAMGNLEESGGHSQAPDYGSSSRGSPFPAQAPAWGYMGNSEGSNSGPEGPQRDRDRVDEAVSDGNGSKSLSKPGRCQTAYDGPVLTWNIRGGPGPAECHNPSVVAEGWPVPGVGSLGMHSHGTPVAAEARGHGGAGVDSWGTRLEGAPVATPSRREGGAGVDRWGIPPEGAHVTAQARSQGGPGVDPWGTPWEGTHDAAPARGQGGAGTDLWVNPLEAPQFAANGSGQCLQQSEGRTVAPLNFKGREHEEQLGLMDRRQAEWAEKETRHAMWIPAHAASWKRPGASPVKLEPQSEGPLDCQGSYAEAARLARQRDEQERQRQRQVAMEKLATRRAASRCVVTQPRQLSAQKEEPKIVPSKSQTRYARLLPKRSMHGQQGTPAQAESSKGGLIATEGDSATKSSEADAVLQPLSLSAEEAKLVASLQRLDGAIHSSRRLPATTSPPSLSPSTPPHVNSQPHDQPLIAPSPGPADRNTRVDVPKGHVVETGAVQLAMHSHPACGDHEFGRNTGGETKEGKQEEDKKASSSKSRVTGGKRGPVVQATTAANPGIPQVPGKGKRFGVWSRPVSEPAAGRVANGQAAANPAADEMASRASRLQRLTQRKNAIRPFPQGHGPTRCCDTVSESTAHQPKSGAQNLTPCVTYTSTEHGTYPVDHNPMSSFGTMSTFRGPAVNGGPEHPQAQRCWPDSKNERQRAHRLHHGAPQVQHLDYHAHPQAPEVQHMSYHAQPQSQVDNRQRVHQVGAANNCTPSALHHRLYKRTSDAYVTPPSVVQQRGLQSMCGSVTPTAQGATAAWPATRGETSPAYNHTPLPRCRATRDTELPIKPSTADTTAMAWGGPEPQSREPYTEVHAAMQHLNGNPQGLPVDLYSQHNPVNSSTRASSAHALNAERPLHSWAWPQQPHGWGQRPQMCGPNAYRPLAWEPHSVCQPPPIYPPQASTATPASTSASPYTTVSRDVGRPLPWPHVANGQGPPSQDACHEQSASSGKSLTCGGDGAGALMGLQPDAPIPHYQSQNPGGSHGQQRKDPSTHSPAVKATGWDCLFWPEEAPDTSPSGENSVCRDQVRMLAGRVGEAAVRASMCASPMSNRKSRVGPLGAQSHVTRRFSPASAGRSPSEKSGGCGYAANSPPQRKRHAPVKRPTGGTITSFNWKAWQGC